MARRQAVDPETAAIATERLTQLLAELQPRRASPERPPPGRARVSRFQAIDDPDDGDAGDPDAAEAAQAAQARRLASGPTDGRSPRPAVRRDASGPGNRRSSTAKRSAEAGSEPAEPVPRRSRDESWPDRARTFGRRHLGVLAVLLVIGLAAAGWALLRARPVAVATPMTVATTAAPVEASRAASSTASVAPPPAADGAGSERASPGPRVLVHVIGEVRRPGVVELAAGARVDDAVRAAGGLTGAARPGELNLAQVVSDGQQIVIGSRRHPGGAVREGTVGSSGTGTGTGGSGGPGAGADGNRTGSGRPAMVDLNTATVADLDVLPGVGPVTAERILAWRAEHGRFTRVEELQEVDGIGPKTYARLAPHVRV